MGPRPLEYLDRPIYRIIGSYFVFYQIFTPRIKPQTQQIRVSISIDRNVFSLDVDEEHTGRQRMYTADSTLGDGQRHFFAMHAKFDDWLTKHHRGLACT